ncbi:protocatechuate 3,4-dioxygenase subunit alpha [Actinomadura sp. NBRC 104425]|uniref:protocatechuate 3,4-dioxygenase subunit alpha n=1 Tax=Actinomadura sp. NBRC 104425 TaxID=3032204 RepID=UPI0024A1335B|nr:protocatechuate 3,4-dioxygenase subunit alpha [Actinomadura sp. NBRC 104425]GLZ12807.1 protocatechuate 3,4-dioxygenase subunit alpha [Actinomadura sp. NBRC 104425]
MTATSGETTPATPALGLTPSQTVGPFYGFALPYDDGPTLAPGWHKGAIRLHGQVFDGAGDPVPDALLEIWQADADGSIPRRPGGLRRAGHDFSGFGRCGTDPAGHYWFSTVKPGSTGDGAPYIALLVFARGLLKPVFTRVYFPEDTAAHVGDPVLGVVPEDRRATLIAERDGEASYRFDVHLQGERETVFFDL